MEARRLQQLYPNLNIAHLEGIVSYIHSHPPSKLSNPSTMINSKDSQTKQSPKSLLPILVHPETNKPTIKIHTFSRQWDYTGGNNEAQIGDDTAFFFCNTFEPIYFSLPTTFIQMVMVGFRSVRYKFVSLYS